jgi:hypothetical protein
MSWPGFPKRLQSALRGPAAGTMAPMQSWQSQNTLMCRGRNAILQLLVWAGFITSPQYSGRIQLAVAERDHHGRSHRLLSRPAPGRTRPGLPHFARFTEVNGTRPGEVWQADTGRGCSFPGACLPEQPHQPAKWTTCFKDPEFFNSQAETKEPIQCYESQIDVPPQNFS